ncbi:RseA family anti-sigma factor [Chitinibacter sp. SCUT-21]|uniref:sigma-E factor negative regulatory protein n=1 Tax=Chitinibacter sp. SCUT-21 TaxID=2970891 RepID=UPI0035A6B661
MNEKLSALMDGELPNEQWDEVLDALKQDVKLQAQWQEWHATKDAMQGLTPLSNDFMTKFSARLAAEPRVIAPNRLQKPKRWWVPLSAAASVAFVGLAVWQFNLPSSTPHQQLASADVSNVQHVQVDAAEVRAYLAAHRSGLANPMGEDHLAQVSFEVGEQR